MAVDGLRHHRQIVVGRMGGLGQLERLYLQNNPITVFPDAAGPGNALQFLVLTNTTIEHFPDLPQMGKALTHLQITGEGPRFHRIPTSRILNFPNLRRLDLNMTDVRIFPDFSQVSTPRGINLYLTETELSCDKNIMLLKVMQLHNKIRIHDLSQPTCRSDDGGVYKYLNDVNPREMLKGYYRFPY